MNFPLVTNKPSIIENIKTFDNSLTNKTLNGLESQLGRFKCWYAWYDEQNLIWRFSPSKFTGYLSISIENYLNNHNELDGKITELQLSKYRDIVNDSQFQLLESLLYERLSIYRKRPSANTKIYIIKDDEPMSKISYIPADAKNLKFYYEDLEATNKKTSKPIVSNDNTEIKFDLTYDGDSYSLVLKKTGTDIYKGIATKLGDRLEIDVSAHVAINEYNIEINGFEWFENGKNYPFKISFDAE